MKIFLASFAVSSLQSALLRSTMVLVDKIRNKSFKYIFAFRRKLGLIKHEENGKSNTLPRLLSLFL